MESTNPIFKNFGSPKPLGGQQAIDPGRMSLPGTLYKTAILLALFSITAACSWIEIGSFQHEGKYMTLVLALVFLACTLGAVALVWITVRRKWWSPITAPIYALMQGVFVGFASVGMDRRFPGIAIQAVGLTIAISLCLIVAYRRGFIRVTESFNKKLGVATAGVLVYYIGSLAIALASRHTLYKIIGGVPGILISVVVVAIAGMSLVSNFDFAVQFSREKFPKYMEWYAALGLLVTLLWLYLETLDLLSKARRAEGQ